MDVCYTMSDNSQGDFCSRMQFDFRSTMLEEMQSRFMEERDESLDHVRRRISGGHQRGKADYHGTEPFGAVLKTPDNLIDAFDHQIASSGSCGRCQMRSSSFNGSKTCLCVGSSSDSVSADAFVFCPSPVSVRLTKSLPVGSRAQFFRTRLCPMLLTGCDRGPDCSYAHDEADLRPSINLSKTKLCLNFARKAQCERGGQCPFAHGSGELRATSGFYKTSLCKFYDSGGCPAGMNCRHAHGHQELRRQQRKYEGELRKRNRARKRVSNEVDSISPVADAEAAADAKTPMSTTSVLLSSYSSLFASHTTSSFRVPRGKSRDGVRRGLALPHTESHKKQRMRASSLPILRSSETFDLRAVSFQSSSCPGSPKKAAIVQGAEMTLTPLWQCGSLVDRKLSDSGESDIVQGYRHNSLMSEKTNGDKRDPGRNVGVVGLRRPLAHHLVAQDGAYPTRASRGGLAPGTCTGHRDGKRKQNRTASNRFGGQKQDSSCPLTLSPNGIPPPPPSALHQRPPPSLFSPFGSSPLDLVEMEEESCSNILSGGSYHPIGLGGPGSYGGSAERLSIFPVISGIASPVYSPSTCFVSSLTTGIPASSPVLCVVPSATLPPASALLLVPSASSSPISPVSSETPPFSPTSRLPSAVSSTLACLFSPPGHVLSGGSSPSPPSSPTALRSNSHRGSIMYIPPSYGATPCFMQSSTHTPYRNSISGSTTALSEPVSFSRSFSRALSSTCGHGSLVEQNNSSSPYPASPIGSYTAIRSTNGSSSFTLIGLPEAMKGTDPISPGTPAGCSITSCCSPVSCRRTGEMSPLQAMMDDVRPDELEQAVQLAIYEE